MLPRSDSFCRAWSVAKTTLPSTKRTSTSSGPFLRTSFPVFVWCPMSWRMSAMPKSLRVPESAISSPLGPLARGDVAEADAVGEQERSHGYADPEHGKAAPDGIRRVGKAVEEHHAHQEAGRHQQEDETAQGISEQHVPRAGKHVGEPDQDRLAALVAIDGVLLADPLARIDAGPAHEDVHALGAERFGGTGIRVAALADLAAAAVAAAG